MNRIMKESGIEWLGQIPNDWEIRPLKFILQVRNQKNNPVISEEILSLSIDKGVTLYAEKTTNKDRFKEDLTQYKLAYPNDIVMNSMNVIVGAVGISKYLGCVSPVYYVLFSSNQEKYLVEYYDYLFKTSTIRKVFFSLGRGIMSIEKENDRVNTCRLKVSMNDLGRMDFPVPPFGKQKQIVDFLEEKCADIDNLIALQQQMIDELKVYKQSVITEVVCKGLDKSVLMKDSGIEWIGEIPEHWEILKLKYITSNSTIKCTESMNYIGLENVESFSSRYVETDNNYDTSQAIQCKTGDVLFGKLRPYLAKVYVANEPICCSSEFVVFTNIDCPNYLKYLLLSNWFIKIVDASTYGAKMPRANVEYIKNMFVVFPPISEQKLISTYLDKLAYDNDCLISIKQQKIDELKEYKKSIIYECITGKKEVAKLTTKVYGY